MDEVKNSRIVCISNRSDSPLCCMLCVSNISLETGALNGENMTIFKCINQGLQWTIRRNYTTIIVTKRNLIHVVSISINLSKYTNNHISLFKNHIESLIYGCEIKHFNICREGIPKSPVTDINVRGVPLQYFSRPAPFRYALPF